MFSGHQELKYDGLTGGQTKLFIEFNYVQSGKQNASRDRGNSEIVKIEKSLCTD